MHMMSRLKKPTRVIKMDMAVSTGYCVSKRSRATKIMKSPFPYRKPKNWKYLSTRCH